MLVEGTIFGMVDIKDCMELSKDDDVDGVGSGCWIVGVAEGLEESSEYGMQFSSGSLFSGIWLTHVGDPLAHGKEGFVHRISSDRLVGCSFLLIPESWQ